MNEQLQQTIIDLLKSGKDFALNEAPEIVHQYLQLKLLGVIASVLTCAVFTCAAIFGIFGARKLYDEKQYDNFPSFFIGGICIVVFGVFFALFISSIMDGTAILFYPKGYLLEEMLPHHGCGR